LFPVAWLCAGLLGADELRRTLTRMRPTFEERLVPDNGLMFGNRVIYDKHDSP